MHLVTAELHYTRTVDCWWKPFTLEVHGARLIFVEYWQELDSWCLATAASPNNTYRPGTPRQSIFWLATRCRFVSGVNVLRGLQRLKSTDRSCRAHWVDSFIKLASAIAIKYNLSATKEVNPKNSLEEASSWETIVSHEMKNSQYSTCPCHSNSQLTDTAHTSAFRLPCPKKVSHSGTKKDVF